MKYYLIPEIKIITKEFPDGLRQPKGIQPIGVDWVACDLGKYFLVSVNTKDEDKYDEISQIDDVVSLDDDINAKTKVELVLNINISKDDDLVEIIGKRVDSNFDRSKLKIIK